MAVAAVGDDLGVQAVAGIAVQGNQALVVAQFADMDAAKAAYYALVDAEVKRAIDIHGVLVANADYQGKIHIQKMTDHKTRNGFLWGAVGGAVIGLIFPPTILAGAVGVGVAGAAVGKAGNVLMKSDVADELASVIAPGTSGIVALVSITAVDAVQETIPDAKVVKSAPVSDETATAVQEAARPAATRRPVSVCRFRPAGGGENGQDGILRTPSCPEDNGCDRTHQNRTPIDQGEAGPRDRIGVRRCVASRSPDRRAVLDGSTVGRSRRARRDGQGGPQAGPSGQPCGVRTRPRTRPDRDPGRPGGGPAPGPGSPPPRADGRVGVRLLPRDPGRHGVRSRDHPAHGHRGPGER